MKSARTILAVLAAAAVGAVGATQALAIGNASITIEKTPALGKVVADAKGHTLYLFRADHGTKSACYGQCTTYWPPLLTKGKPAAAAGLKASLLGTAKRTDGTLQVTYKGHPLYTFLVDKKAGQTAGEGLNEFGAKWYALAPSGATIDRD
jgi:predicted lipoprotein with Yx(FWY)xxD motif